MDLLAHPGQLLFRLFLPEGGAFRGVGAGRGQENAGVRPDRVLEHHLLAMLAKDLAVLGFGSAFETVHGVTSLSTGLTYTVR